MFYFLKEKKMVEKHELAFICVNKWSYSPNTVLIQLRLDRPLSTSADFLVRTERENTEKFYHLCAVKIPWAAAF